VLDLLDGHRGSRVGRFTASERDVLHDDGVVESGTVDEDVVGVGVVDRYAKRGCIELGLVEEVAVPGMGLTEGTLSFDEEDGWAGSPGVGDSEPSASVGAVVPFEDVNGGDLDVGQVANEGGRHPVRGDLRPVAGDLVARLVARARPRRVALPWVHEKTVQAARKTTLPGGSLRR
jgi:hypothetical protein